MQIINPEHLYYFEWPLWFYVDANPETPVRQINPFVIPNIDGRELVFPVFTRREKAEKLGAENVPSKFKLLSLKQAGFIKFLKEVALNRGVRFLSFDNRISALTISVIVVPVGSFIFDNTGPWWKTRRFRETLECVYCGRETDRHHAVEHVIPESLGCKETLYRGAVCTKCNHALGINVDAKIFEEPLMASAQVAAGTLGKEGVRQIIGRYVTGTKGRVEISGGQSGSPNQFVMSRAIAKCGVNILTHRFGSLTVRQELAELIDYVNAPKNRNDIWPFAAIYTFAGGIKGIKFGVENIVTGGSEYPACLFSCPSGLFATVGYRHAQDAGSSLRSLITKIFEESCTRNKAQVAHMIYQTG